MLDQDRNRWEKRRREICISFRYMFNGAQVETYMRSGIEKKKYAQ